jgi:tetrapyrrole methylase family protein/MazG family protein
MARLDIIGLGPAGADLMGAGSRRLWEGAPHRFLRTSRHPAAAALGDAPSFDHLYERLGTFEEVYAAIVEALVAEARAHGRVVYAVPGSPSVAESTVEGLLAAARADADLEVVVHPAMSFVDLVWARLGVDPLRERVCLVDGHRFAQLAPSDGGAVLVAQCESRFTLSDIKLAVDPAPEAPVVLLCRLGLPDEQVLTVAWSELDRTVEPDHLTSLWIPELPPGAGGRLDDLAELMERLRVQDAWKAAQTHRSLGRYLIEESHEVLEAVDGYDPATGQGAAELTGELGDLLYQVVFHASLGADAGWFDLAGVVAAIHDKLVARHPHLDSGEAPTLEELVADWEQAKRVEHRRESAFDGIPDGLPSLLRALKLARKAEALGLGLPGPRPGSPAAGLMAAAMELVAAGEDPEDVLRRELRGAEDALRAGEDELRAAEQ